MHDPEKAKARYRRYKARKKAANAQAFAATIRAATARYTAAHRHQRNERRREKSWRLNAGSKEIAHGDALAELSAAQMKAPRFTWLDQHGTLHAEFWETAEELIARLTASEKTTKKKGSHA